MAINLILTSPLFAGGSVRFDAMEVTHSAGSENTGTQTSGAGSGKVTFNPFSITRKLDKSSPVLYKYGATGTHFPQATIQFAQKGDKASYLEINLNDVYVSNYQMHSSGETPMESLDIVFGDIIYSTFDPDSGALIYSTEINLEYNGGG